MKLLLAVICIAIVGALSAGITLEQIKTSNLGVGYKLKISSGTGSEEGNGYFEFWERPDYYFSEDLSIINVLVPHKILISGLEISGEDKTEATIESGATSYLKPGVAIEADDTIEYAIRYTVEMEIKFDLDTYILDIPFEFKDNSELNVAEKVRVFAKQSASTQNEEGMEGVVVLMENKIKKVKITTPHAEYYKEFIVKTERGTDIYTSKPENKMYGPYAEFPIQVKQKSK